MADTTAVSHDPVHQEGVDHIKAKLEETSISAPVAEPSASAAAHTESTPPAIVSEPPASNPGADDKTGGIAPGAGGVSGSAHADIPNPAVARPNAEKRKSVFGSFKGIFSKKDKETASDGTYLGAATAAATAAAAAVTETVHAYTGPETKTETTTTTGGDAAADDSKPALAEQKAAEAEASTAGTVDAPAAVKATDEPAGAAETEGTGPAAAAAEDEGAAKEVAASDEAGTDKDKMTHRTNPDAIPTAGDKPVGADHAGESKIVPDDPGAQPTDDPTLARITGQPSTETADNTAKNAGTAADPSEKKKGGFMSKIKEKLNKKKD